MYGWREFFLGYFELRLTSKFLNYFVRNFIMNIYVDEAFRKGSKTIQDEDLTDDELDKSAFTPVISTSRTQKHAPASVFGYTPVTPRYSSTSTPGI